MTHSIFRLLLVLQCSLTLAGCENQSLSTDRSNPPVADAAATAAAAPAQAALDPATPQTSDSGVKLKHDLRRGKDVFTGQCLACHGSGELGAPQLGSAADWEARLDQDLDTLIQHAIRGHGRMPPKGGFAELTDTDVAAAVAFVVDRSRRVVRAVQRQEVSAECHPVRNPAKCTGRDLEEVLTLHMLWLLGNPGEQ